jgi:hypothetical protein
MESLPVRLLAALGEGGIRSTADLARDLDVTPTLVTVMTEELARRGWLAPVDGGCGSCAAAGRSQGRGCGALCAPRAGSGPALYALSSEGRRAWDRQRPGTA